MVREFVCSKCLKLVTETQLADMPMGVCQKCRESEYDATKRLFLEGLAEMNVSERLTNIESMLYDILNK